MKKSITILILLFNGIIGFTQSYAPHAGQPGSTAIHKDSNVFVGWATGVSVQRGYIQIDDTTKTFGGSNRATFGEDSLVFGKPNGTTTRAISLGDSGTAIVTFDLDIANGAGWDFAIFENGVTDNFLELATVSVSSDGVHFFEFPSHSEIPFLTQTASFGSTDCRYIHNLAGKYKLNYGTPFDLEDITDDPMLDKDAIKYIKITDVVGSINPLYATHDSHGNIINDPYPTPFNTSGFDLTGVGIINGKSLTTNSVTYSSFSIYPTIVQQDIYISSNANFDYTLINLEGKIVVKGTGIEGKNILNLQHLKSGSYLIKVQSKDYLENFRLIKL